jgi:hypothetical protein
MEERERCYSFVLLLYWTYGQPHVTAIHLQFDISANALEIRANVSNVLFTVLSVARQTVQNCLIYPGDFQPSFFLHLENQRGQFV